MALTSVYYDGPVTESDRAKNRTGAPDYGVYGPDDFKVTAHPSIPYAVLVKAGRAHGHGVTDTAEEDQVVQCASITSGVRWDLIVVRRNWQPALGGPSTLAAIQVGSSPVIPDPPIRKVGPGVEDDQPVFLVKWQGGVSAPVDFIDLRVWAGNGGLYAKNDLVRSYMNKVGTELNINGINWEYRLGDNDIAGWVKIGEDGKVPLFGNMGGRAGGVPAAGTQFLIQTGSTVLPQEVNGYGTVWLPKAFPNGILSAVVTNGDLATTGRGWQAALNGTGPNRDALFVNLSNGSGVGYSAGIWRCDWIAIGW